MIRTILVPLDGSPFAEQALPAAATLARVTGARIRLALVHDLTPPRLRDINERIYVSHELQTRRSEKAYLERQAERLRGEVGGEVSAVTLDPPVAPALAEQARVVDADLVVMTTHGRGMLSRFWLGSVADELVRTLHVPMLLIRPREDGERVTLDRAGGRILVPLDGSAFGEAALEPAVEIATRLGAGLTLMHAVEPLVFVGEAGLVYPGAIQGDIITARREQAQDYLASAAEPLRDRGVRVDTAAVVGTGVAATVLDAAAGEDVIMIALSTHGRSGAGRLLLGSVADKLIRAAPRPVLVVRPRGD